MSEENKAVIHHFNDAVMEFFRTGNGDPLANVVSPNLVMHMPGMPPIQSLEAFKQGMGMYRAGLSDMESAGAEDLISEGAKVAYRLSWSATHTGDLMGIPPTGKRVTVSEMHIARIEDGKIAERWVLPDALGMMQQLGVIPAP